MYPATRTTLCFLLLLLGIVSIGAITAQARQGFYLGGGFSSVSASGDLDGTKFLSTASGTEADVLGNLGSGTGYNLEIGYGFNKYLGIDYLFTHSKHNASVIQNIFPDTTATVDVGLLAFRLTAPVLDSLEIFAKVGAATGTVKYADYSVQGTTSGGIFTASGSTGQFELDGSGSGYGVGVEFLMDHVGFELAYTAINITFDQGKGTAASGTLPSSQKEAFTIVTGNILYHF
jgi:hypothetical protein